MNARYSRMILRHISDRRCWMRSWLRIPRIKGESARRHFYFLCKPRAHISTCSQVEVEFRKRVSSKSGPPTQHRTNSDCHQALTPCDKQRHVHLQNLLNLDRAIWYLAQTFAPAPLNRYLFRKTSPIEQTLKFREWAPAPDVEKKFYQ